MITDKKKKLPCGRPPRLIIARHLFSQFPLSSLVDLGKLMVTILVKWNPLRRTRSPSATQPHLPGLTACSAPPTKSAPPKNLTSSAQERSQGSCPKRGPKICTALCIHSCKSSKSSRASGPRRSNPTGSPSQESSSSSSALSTRW